LSSIKILFIEDNKPLALNFSEYFTASDYILDFASDGLTALHLLATNSYDIIVLDYMLPGVDGLSIIKRLRGDLQSNTPVLMLTALDDLTNKTACFEAGADDYLCKPFDFKELELRIKAMLRRSAATSKQLTVANLRYDLGSLQLKAEDGAEVSLTGYPSRILELLMRSYPNYTSFSDINNLWGEHAVDDNTIRTHVYSLRKTFKHYFGKGMIKSLHKRGYQFDPEQD
jgi:DNA-binding response OmpR family regulator